MTPKQIVLQKFPNAELVRDGWHEKAGPSGCFDFAIYSGKRFLAEGSSVQEAWVKTSRLITNRDK